MLHCPGVVSSSTHNLIEQPFRIRYIMHTYYTNHNVPYELFVASLSLLDRLQGCFETFNARAALSNEAKRTSICFTHGSYLFLLQTKS